MSTTHPTRRTAWRVTGCLLLGLAWPFAAMPAEPLAMGVLTRTVPAEGPWLLRGPAAEKVEYHGVVSFDNAGIGSYGGFYPAPNLIGFLAAIAVHGAISSAAQDKKKAAIRETADKVLEPYQPVLDTILHAQLLPQALSKTSRHGSTSLASAGEVTDRWLIEAVPVFSLTQDQRALVLDNALVVRGPEKDSPVVYQNVVRVVAKPLPGGDDSAPVSATWLADDGRRLREQSAELLTESLDLLFAELARGPGATDDPSRQRTVRYFEGGIVKMERAAPLVERCDRAVLKTLRGWVMSVPRQPAIGEECAEAPAGAAKPVDTASSQ